MPTGDDVPFVQDGVPDGESIRGWMTQRFRERLAERPEPWIEVAGPHEQRLRQAAEAVDSVMRGDSRRRGCRRYREPHDR